MQTTKHKITNKNSMTIWMRSYDKSNFDEPHLLEADRIEFVSNHLMFYLGKELVFKVWLIEGKWQKYKDIKEAMKDAGFIIVK